MQAIEEKPGYVRCVKEVSGVIGIYSKSGDLKNKKGRPYDSLLEFKLSFDNGNV